MIEKNLSAVSRIIIMLLGWSSNFLTNSSIEDPLLCFFMISSRFIIVSISGNFLTLSSSELKNSSTSWYCPNSIRQERNKLIAFWSFEWGQLPPVCY